MSLTTWKKEFYPITAKQAARRGVVKALEHSIQKWRGLLKANLRKHSVQRKAAGHGCITDENASFPISDTSCALCARYCKWDVNGIDLGCGDCPLKTVLGQPCFEGHQPFGIWFDSNDARPMIHALKAALKLVTKPTTRKKAI